MWPQNSQALGVAISPSSLEFIGHYDQKSLQVKNTSKEPIAVKIYTDDFVDSFLFSPSEFELLPEQLYIVNIDSDFSLQKPGVLQTNISVLSKALDNKSFNAISGVKIPVKVYISSSQFIWSGPMVFVLVFLALFLVYFVYRSFIYIFYRKKGKNKPLVDLNFLLHHKKKWYHKIFKLKKQ